ncbi:MAG: type II toxin-antitoxin system Phd/YefM family antitoxin [Chloroflexi bacterium]|nr:type II toxin-antitoxin system Phd/YefM family antitoxin [Chloroflexota bacterium]
MGATRTSYSIAETRNQFAALVRNVEEKKRAIKITRRGKTVAVILSVDEYQRMQRGSAQKGFWEAYQEWRSAWQAEDLSIDDGIWDDVRDRSPMPEGNVWD